MARNNTDSNADDPLLAAFRLFYEAMMAAVPAATPGLPGADGPTVTPEASLAAASLQHQLVQLLELHTLGMRRAGGGRGGALVEDARYLMVALADELLLLRDWPGRSAWPQHLLETALFQSSVAGDKVFASIERLLSDREPSQRSLAQLYLFALALGFRGRLRGMDDAGQLAGLRRELFQFAHQRAPGLDARGHMLAPQPYAHTQSHAAPRRAVSGRRLSTALLLAVAALLVLSELTWLWPTWPLRQALDGLDRVWTGRVL